MQEFRVVEVETEGILDNYAARSLGEYVVERLQSMLLPDGKFKDKKLQAEFEVWLKNREATVFKKYLFYAVEILNSVLNLHILKLFKWLYQTFVLFYATFKST